MNRVCNGTFFFCPAPWGLGEGPKGQISLNMIKFQLQSQFQRFFNQTLCVFSHMKDILTDFNYATLTSTYIFQKTVECKLLLL